MSFGFGGAAPAAGGGFGASAPKPAGGAPGFGAPATQPTGTGFGGGGFGAAQKPAGGGFGTAAAPAQPANTGFGAAAPAGGAPSGFGAPAAGGGFGSAAAKPATTTGFGSTGGGFGGGGFGGGGFGAAAAKPATTGFGAPAGGGFGGGGFGGGGFGGGGGGFGGSQQQPQQQAMPTAQQYPYKGIKGPGNTTSWSQTVDFSQINDKTTFESLPAPLQQHLLELRTFMHAERGAMKTIADYLNDMDTGSGTYRGLVKRLTQLKSGRNATEALGVRCSHRDRDADSFAKSLDSFEAEIRRYQREVWEPMAEEDAASGDKANGGDRAGGRYRPPLTTPQPFVSLVAQLQEHMERLERQLHELEFDLLPGVAEGAYGLSVNTDPLLAAHTSLVSGSRLHSNGMTGGVRGLRGEGSGGGLDTAGTAAVGDVTAQINVALSNELTVLMNLSQWAARLHTRGDSARDLFTRSYGQAEADVLFAPTRSTTGNYAMPARGAGGRGAYMIPFELPRMPAQAAAPPTGPGSAAAPAGGFSGAAPATTGFGAGGSTGFGGGGASVGFGAPTKPATTGFGAAPAPATGGFGAAAPATGGFGAKSAAPAATGFGAPAPAAAPAGTAPTAPGTAAPATAGTSAPGAAGAPAAPSAGFSFGSTAATGTAPAAPSAGPAPAPANGAAAVGFNLGPGSPRFGSKRPGEGDDDGRPEVRKR